METVLHSNSTAIQTRLKPGVRIENPEPISATVASQRACDGTSDDDRPRGSAGLQSWPLPKWDLEERVSKPGDGNDTGVVHVDVRSCIGLA